MLTRVFFLQSTFVWFGTSASGLSGDPSIYLCMCMSSSWLVTQFSHAAACLSVLAHNCSAGLVCIALPCADLWWRGSVRFHNTCWPKHPTWSPSCVHIVPFEPSKTAAREAAHKQSAQTNIPSGAMRQRPATCTKMQTPAYLVFCPKWPMFQIWRRPDMSPEIRSVLSFWFDLGLRTRSPGCSGA